MTSNNMYRVGDFVYFEVSASAPYQIRKIEELNKTPTGAVEAKVVCFYRRRDLSFNLIHLADKHQKEFGIPDDTQPELLHQIRHRELFLSRQLETLPATHIRGKCTVTLHTESEPYHVYLSKEDTFFFQLVYDPLQKTLQADQGTIREGSQYQADVGPYQSVNEDSSDNKVFEELCWRPDNALSSSEIDSYLLLIRSLATLGRAYYPPHMLRQPSLAMSAAAAARDSTHQFALDVLNSSNYDISLALQSVAPNSQPVLKLDEMEQWSASEGNLFEEALEKYGKCFCEIQNDFLPWKHPKSLVEFYYMWKTTDHYIQQKRMKATEAEHHLKQVYIPNYNKPNPVVLYPTTGTNGPITSVPSGCEGCPKTTSPQWYALGPATSPLKVCSDCWNYWKRYGDLKAASILDKVTESIPIGSIPTSLSDSNLISTIKSNNVRISNDSQLRNNQSTNVVMDHSKRTSDIGHLDSINYTVTSKARTGANFNFIASMLLRIARRLRPSTNTKRQARQPFKRLYSLSDLHKDTFPIVSRLEAVEVQNMMKRIRNLNSTDKNNSRGSIVKNLVSRLFNNKSNSTNCVTKAVNKLPVTAEKLVPTTTESVLDLAINGVLASNLANKLKRRASSPKTIENTDLPLKKANTMNSNPDCDHNPVTFGPKRRFSIGPGADEVSTLMYLATSVTKRSRRRLFSIAELRRLGRRPWFKTNVNEIAQNGFHNGPSTKPVKKMSSSNSSTTPDNLVAVPAAENLSADLSAAVSVNPSSSAKPIKPQ